MLKVKDLGREYIEMSYNECTKKSQGDDYKETNDNPIILSQPGNVQCSVNSFKLYLEKVTKIKQFFQQPNPFFKYPNKDKWYKEPPVGEGTIAKFLSKISKISGLSCSYTNHCIWGMTASYMKWAGYSLEEIAFVLKHKNLESLKYYLHCPSLQDKTNFSDSLFESVLDDDSDMSDFETPPPPKKKKRSKSSA